MSSPLPNNVHVSKHPCVRAKLSQLRSHTTSSKDTKSLVHEIATLVGVEALGHGLQTQQGETVSQLPSFSHTPADIILGCVSLIDVCVMCVGPFGTWL